LSLIYGTKRTATIISATNSCLLRLEKSSFDEYVKDIFENQLKDQIEFMQICPIFHSVKKETLIKLTIRTENKRFKNDQDIFEPPKFNDMNPGEVKIKPDNLFMIRRGNVKVFIVNL
jgi:hypothetical protein